MIPEFYEQAVRRFVDALNNKDMKAMNDSNRDLCRDEAKHKNELRSHFGVPENRLLFDFVRKDVLKLKYNYEKI